MKISTKLTITIIPLMLVAIVSLNIAFGIFFQSYVQEQETRQINTVKENIVSYISERKNMYSGTANDWGHWDDTYNYINGEQPMYEDSNFMVETFINLDLSFMIYLDSNENIKYKQFYSFAEEAFTESPSGFLENWPDLVAHSRAADDSIGIFQIGSLFYIIASTDITDSEMLVPPNGKLFIGRLIDEGMIGTLEKITNCTVNNLKIADVKDAGLGEANFFGPITMSENRDSLMLDLYIPNANNYGKELIVSLTMPRDLYVLGMKRATTFALLNTLGFAMIALLVFFILRKRLSSPFVKIIGELQSINIAKMEFTPLVELGDYEFSYLRRTMNTLMKKIEAEHKELNKEREKLKATLISVGDGVIAVDVNGEIEFMNPVAEKLTGWKYEPNLHIDDVFVIIHEYTRESITSPVKLAIEKEMIVELANHTLLVSKEGNEVPIEDTAAPIKDKNNNTIGCVLVFRDSSERKEKQRRIEYLGFHDQLTGLYNRRFFDDELLRIDIQVNLPLTIIYADVNGLKTVNDAFGHHIGDLVIQSVADALKSECRAGDVIARTGGDEFIMLLPKSNNTFGEQFIENLKAKIESIKHSDINISISFGWETKTGADQNIRELLKKAEDNMYRKKFLHSTSKRNATIRSIVNALLVKSPREEEHSRRVSKICEMIGMAYHLSEDELHELKIAGELHDIGKIAVDDAVLNKEGKLTEFEWAQIKRHPETGYRLLGTSNEFISISEYVLAHHERWDGSGYPRGLKGEAIPWKARVIAIADAYDAMTKDRPYRKALSKGQAIEEIKKGAGTQFDPEIAKAFISMFGHRQFSDIDINEPDEDR